MPEGVIRKPDPINQFFRLQYDEVKKAFVKTTRWNNVVDGHNFDAENCMAAQGAVAIDAHTGGSTKSSPPQIRNHQDDFKGGIGIDDVAVAWDRLWGATLLLPDDFSFADVVNATKQGRFQVIAVDYDQIPYELQWQKGGTFDHALGIHDIRADTQMGIYDSLGTSIRYMPQSVVRRAMEKIALKNGRSTGQLYTALTKVREPFVVLVNYKYGGQPTGRGRFIVTGSGHLKPTPLNDGQEIRRLVIGEDIQVRQTTTKGWKLAGSSKWLGTADGNHWVWSGATRYAGPYTGKESIR